MYLYTVYIYMDILSNLPLISITSSVWFHQGAFAPSQFGGNATFLFTLRNSRPSLHLRCTRRGIPILGQLGNFEARLCHAPNQVTVEWRVKVVVVVVFVTKYVIHKWSLNFGWFRVPATHSIGKTSNSGMFLLTSWFAEFLKQGAMPAESTNKLHSAQFVATFWKNGVPIGGLKNPLKKWTKLDHFPKSLGWKFEDDKTFWNHHLAIIPGYRVKSHSHHKISTLHSTFERQVPPPNPKNLPAYACWPCPAARDSSAGSWVAASTENGCNPVTNGWRGNPSGKGGQFLAICTNATEIGCTNVRSVGTMWISFAKLLKFPVELRKNRRSRWCHMAIEEKHRGPRTILTT